MQERLIAWVICVKWRHERLNFSSFGESKKTVPDPYWLFKPNYAFDVRDNLATTVFVRYQFSVWLSSRNSIHNSKKSRERRVNRKMTASMKFLRIPFSQFLFLFFFFVPILVSVLPHIFKAIVRRRKCSSTIWDFFLPRLLFTFLVFRRRQDASFFPFFAMGEKSRGLTWPTRGNAMFCKSYSRCLKPLSTVY